MVGVEATTQRVVAGFQVTVENQRVVVFVWWDSIRQPNTLGVFLVDAESDSINIESSCRL